MVRDVLVLSDSDLCINSQTIRVNIVVNKSCCELLEQFLTRRCAMIILDVDFLRERITKMVKVLRLLNEKITIMLIYSEENTHFFKESLSMGITSSLIKPFSEDELLEHIHNIALI